MRHTFQLGIAGIALAVLVCAQSAVAQTVTSGDIRGTVTDTTGAVIPGVAVTVENVDTGVVFHYVTDGSGVYDTGSIIPDHYKLTFKKDGFNGLERGPIMVDVGSAGVNAVLKVGTSSTVVTVTDDVPLLQTESGSQTTTLGLTKLEALPQVSESWENFMILQPGTAGQSIREAGESLENNPGEIISANGNMPYSSVLLNGSSVTMSHGGNTFTNNSFDATQEVQISLSSFSAEYGVGGMVMNQITKSGTEKFHGDAYEYLQNNALEAAPYYFGTGAKPPTPAYHYDEFGGSIGGPILKKKVFFFFNYDRVISHQGESNSFSTIPTTGNMSGNFSNDVRTLYDPTTQTIAYDSLGNPYPVRQSFTSEYGETGTNANAMPSGMIDKVANALQQLWYPTPSHNPVPQGHFIPGNVDSNGTVLNNWSADFVYSVPVVRYTGRLDYDISQNNRLSIFGSDVDNPYVDFQSNFSNCPIGCQDWDNEMEAAQVADVWSISPSTINEVKLSFTYFPEVAGDTSLGHNFPAQIDWQFAKANSLPSINFNSTNSNAAGSYSSLDAQSNSVYDQMLYDLSDVVTMIRGKHILHFGGDLLTYLDNATQWGNENSGTMSFSGAYTGRWTLSNANCPSGTAASDTCAAPDLTTGIDYADFLLGLSGSWNATVFNEYGGRLKNPEMFVQDDYKIRPNLTINLGVRYDITHGWSEVRGNESSFDPTIINPATNTPGAMWYGITHANGRRNLEASHWNTVLPRLGFSWVPMRNLTIRGGFGMYDHELSEDQYGGGLGTALSSSGSISDQTHGVNPIVQLDGTGVIYGTNTPLPYVQASTAPDAYNGQSVSYFPYHVPIQKINQYNLSVQRQFGANMAIQVAYIGSHGFDLIGPDDANAVPMSEVSANDAAYRPYPNFQSISSYALGQHGVSNYNSLQVSIDKRMSSGLSFDANYTWSQFLSDQDSTSWNGQEGVQPYQLSGNIHANYSNSSYDLPQALKGTVVYHLPFGRGNRFLNDNTTADAVIGGWQLSGSVTAFSGQPFTVYSNGNTYQLASGATQFPNWNPGVSPKPAHRSTSEWFNPAAFLEPANGTLGNVRRNALFGPGMSAINLSLGKEFTLPMENMKLQIRADAANAPNHPSLGAPDEYDLTTSNGVGTAYAGPNVDQIQHVAVPARNVQLSARVSF
jgi:Carboxypeptidase regulatory-like domain